MKVEMGFLERAYYANLLRIRAATQRELAEERTMSATRDELLAESRWCETQARKLDDATEEKSVTEKEPIRVNGTTRIDVDYMDEKGGTS